MTDISRELLRLSWPEGYLATRGVMTIGGWECVTAGLAGIRFIPGADVDVTERANVGSRGICVSHITASNHKGILRAGDLLPNVDPADFVTWACLLQSLASLLEAPKEILKLRWYSRYSGPGHFLEWFLSGEDLEGEPWSSGGFCLDERADRPTGWELMNDESLALVHAHIATRERIEKKKADSCR